MAEQIDEKTKTKLLKRMERFKKRCNKINAKFYQFQNQTIENIQKNLNSLQLNFLNMDSKSVKDQLKNLEKELKDVSSKKRKEEKEQKIEFNETLEKARIEKLPLNDNKKKIYLLVDGYNIIGCDSYSRTQMRKNKAKARQYWVELLQRFHEKHNNNNIEEIILLFDGKGKNTQNNHLNVVYSCQQSVDDMIVSQLNFNNNTDNNIFFDIISKNNNNNNNNDDNDEKKNDNNYDNNKVVIVVTSDRELTYRLYNLNCGILIMKSGAFYNQYIKDFTNADKESNTNNNKMNTDENLTNTEENEDDNSDDDDENDSQ